MTTAVGEDTSRAYVLGVLTAVARRTDDHGEARDFARLVAAALASVAANIGRTKHLFAGRSGSWEALLVDDLIRGTVGEHQIELALRRTEPITIPLNVAELVEDGYEHAGLLGLYEALAEVDRRFEGSTADAEDTASELEVNATEERYSPGYRAYGAAFAAAVMGHAVSPRLPRDAAVIDIDDDPGNAWRPDGATRNRDDWDEGESKFRLGSFAHAAVPLPSVDVPRPQQSIKVGVGHE